MIAFENAPLSFVPKIGGFCVWNIANMITSSNTNTWSADDVGHVWTRKFLENRKKRRNGCFRGGAGGEFFHEELAECSERRGQLGLFLWVGVSVGGGGLGLTALGYSISMP